MPGKLVLDFLNTRWYLTHKFDEEILTNSLRRKEFLEMRHLHVKAACTDEIVKSLLELRRFLAEVLEGYIVKGEVSAAAIEKIQCYLASMTYRKAVRSSEKGIQLFIEPLEYDWNWIIAEIVVSFIELVEQGEKNRIKMCENPDCKWFFYDETKSRTKRWCDDKCANLMKVRNFRAKQKQESLRSGTENS